MPTEAPTTSDYAIIWLEKFINIDSAIEHALALWGDGDVPAGWIGGQLRGYLPYDLDMALYLLQETEDPTGTIGAYFYPKERT